MATFYRSVDTLVSVNTTGTKNNEHEAHAWPSLWHTSASKLATVYQAGAQDTRPHQWAIELDDNRQQTRSSYSEPDLHAWLQVLSGFFIFMNTWGVINAFGVFQTFYSEDLLRGTSESAIAWIGTSTSFLLCASPIFWGPVFDLGFARLLVIAGSLSIVFGIMMTSLCQHYWQLILSQGICVGVGGGCAFVTAVSILPAYFTTRRALAMGVAASGSSLGGIIYPIIFHELQSRVGFGWAVRTIGFVAMATLIVPCLSLRPMTKPQGIRKMVDTSMLKDVDYQMFNAATFFGFVGQYIPFFFIQVFAISHGLGIAFWMLILLNIGSLPGRIIPSLLADKVFRPMLVLAACTSCASLLAFCWIAIKHSTAGLAIWALFYGFFSGAFVSLQGPAVASMTSDMRTIGTRFGFNMFCGAVGILIGSPVGGAIFPVSWPGAQAFCGTTLLLSVVMVVVTDMHWRNKG